jgi:hypothetical protein
MRFSLLVRALLPLTCFSALLAPGCGGSDVPEASCSSCGNSAYTEENCRAWGSAAGCKSSRLVSASCNSCEFEDCDSPPECDVGPGPTPDAGNTMDAALEPECEFAPDGLFTVEPPCEDPGTIMANGQTWYVCNCDQPCPCAFECGSIDLPVGGTAGGVCAPPP